MAQTVTSPFGALSGEAFAPAKLNLALRIVGRRDDGYHLLEMFNVPLLFGDTVQITLRPPTIKIVGGGVEGGLCTALPLDFNDIERNLAARAADAFLKTLGVDVGYEISIVKRIPAGAGLGGGSSDAAAVLMVLQRLLTPWSRCSFEELCAIGVRLGADVPFFLGGKSAIVRGIGEVVVPTASGEERATECLVIVPRCHVPTPYAYGLYRERYPVIPARPPAEVPLEVAVQQGETERLVMNDLEAVVSHHHPEVGEVLNVARSIAGCVAGMTGSGCAVFCLPRGGGTFQKEVLNELTSRLPCPFIRTRALGWGGR